MQDNKTKAPASFAQGTCKLSHTFDKEGREEEIKLVRKNLLDWYSVNKRTLPWRTIASSPNSMDDDVRGYSVWVSEIMLQQTRVSTVIGNACYLSNFNFKDTAISG